VKTKKPTLTFLLGLCGAGKTTYGNKLAKKTGAILFDEGLIENRDDKLLELIKVLMQNKDCIVTEIKFCGENSRNKFVEYIKGIIPRVKFKWICFDNSEENIYKACINVFKRSLKKEKSDPFAHIDINFNCHKHYTIPDGAKILQVNTDWK